jgi:beta-N-acetylhexosaminidase
MWFKIIFSLLLTGFLNMAIANNIPLKDKIGQMLIIGFKGLSLQPSDPIVQSILANRIGGVILFDYDFQTKKYERNIQSPEQVKHLTTQLQDYAYQAAQTKQQKFTPLLISIDYEGGTVNRLKENYGFPKTVSAADIGLGSLDQATQYATQMAETLQQAGINLNFAPVVDVNVNPDNPVIGKLKRSFSDDPQKVTEYAAVFSKAYQEKGILCAYKHFPGHGSSTGDTHAGFVDVTQTWKDYELNPYKDLFQASYHCPIVMTSHVVHEGLDPAGYPASLSFAMTQTLLRDKLQFQGVVVTDDLQMKAISDNYSLPEAVQLAINAGADLLVFGNQLVPVAQDPEEIVEMIYQDVRAGKISEARIDEAYQRILKLKEQIM